MAASRRRYWEMEGVAKKIDALQYVQPANVILHNFGLEALGPEKEEELRMAFLLPRDVPATLCSFTGLGVAAMLDLKRVQNFLSVTRDMVYTLTEMVLYSSKLSGFQPPRCDVVTRV
eukprot:CAMPEP_0177592932 /NCGR_PEP_ID=MMETSP0419_2-20121207/8836_1 /TAXON_ID=582737 /ORGANISM="Tetraselmis sp., Strain GSL018" /LENGTH=116 /DNA_ID=CAMNT_0019083857 /DNA_START=153 /DNA_END=500 /DNA_ORIENTATION=+